MAVEKPTASSVVEAAVERRLLWKIDALLVPLLTVSYGLQFYDKFVFSSAAVFGMLADVHLSTPVPGTKLVSTKRYSTATAAFYWGYLIGVLPMALTLRRLPPAKTLSFFILVWGALAMAHASLSSFAGAVALRFFLGLVESSVSPGFVLVTTSWYKPSELPVRLGLWYSATGLFTVFAGIVNYELGLHVRGGLAPWKYMYIIAGAITIFWSGVLLLLLPDTPAQANRWLFSQEECRILTNRAEKMRDDRNGVEWVQLKEAARDPKIWLMGSMGAAIYVCNGGVTAFGSLIIKSFGYTSLESILLQAPGGATTCIAIYITTILIGPSRFGLRNAHHTVLALSCIPVLVGTIILWKGPPYAHARGTALAGYYLLPTFGAPYVTLLSLAAANIRGHTKRAFGAGAVFVGYCVGNIVGPYLVNTDEAPVKYRTTWIAIIAVMVYAIVASFMLRIYLARENRTRDQLYGITNKNRTEKGVMDEETRDTSLSRSAPELTDWEDLHFRYTL